MILGEKEIELMLQLEEYLKKNNLDKVRMFRDGYPFPYNMNKQYIPYQKRRIFRLVEKGLLRVFPDIDLNTGRKALFLTINWENWEKVKKQVLGEDENI